jgi:hypothetical protein
MPRLYCIFREQQAQRRDPQKLVETEKTKANRPLHPVHTLMCLSMDHLHPYLIFTSEVKR